MAEYGVQGQDKVKLFMVDREGGRREGRREGMREGRREGTREGGRLVIRYSLQFHAPRDSLPL